MWYEINDEDHTIHSRMTYLSMYTPLHTNAEGLFESLQHRLHCFGISHITQESASDGALPNNTNNGLRGLVEKKLPWMWCLAHRTELVIRNALLSTTCFQLINDILYYYIYIIFIKSPQKSAENW